MPRTLFGYIWKISARHQVALAMLSVVVFLLSAVPLELQRRLVNDAIARGATDTIAWLALAGLAKVNDPWGDIVNWFRTMTESGMRYRLVADAMRWLSRQDGDA